MAQIALTVQSAVPYDHQQEIESAAFVVKDFTMVPFTGLATNYRLVRHLDEIGIEGAVVECGVWRGGSAGMMAIAHMASGLAHRTFELFDSFCDMPPPDEAVDGVSAVEMARQFGGERVAGDTTPMVGFFERAGFGGAGHPDYVHQLLEAIIGYPSDRLRVHEGWVQDTLPVSDTGPIALLRLDVDWHAATLVCLDHLYDQVVPGGFVVIDDYGAFDGCRTTVDTFLDARGERPFLHHIDADRRYFVKP